MGGGGVRNAPALFLLSMALQIRANSWYSAQASPADTIKVGGAIACTSIFSRSQYDFKLK